MTAIKILSSLMVISLLCNFHVNEAYNTKDFPYPQVWRIKNMTNEPISFNVFYKSRYPGIFNLPKDHEMRFDSNFMTLEAAKEKVIELEPTTNYAYVIEPRRIEVSSAKGKTAWSAPQPGYYNVIVSMKNNNLSIDATPMAVQDIKNSQENFKKTFKRAFDYYFKEVKKQIDQFLAENK